MSVRLRSVAAVVIAVVMAAWSLVPATPADVPGGDVAAGTLTTSMVEMLGEEVAGNGVTLAELRSDIFPWDNGQLGDGTGIDVALIDTGVAPVDGLDGSDKVLHGPDLSFEGASPETAYLDTYGHGTHMAGIIAGDRAGQEGIAPGARLISIKAAGHDGVTTVPQVVAAIDWAIEHRNDDGLNIRVINLSLGQNNVSSHVGDHLSAAAERAWHAGIVVVVAAGNDGDTQAHLDSPAIDPYVIAVGAADSASASNDFFGRSIPDWSGTGTWSRTPDVVAPGRSIASYRVPGSTIDNLAPNARYGADLFLGSGTSQAAAVTSGLSAALLSVRPNLTPDQVKATLEEAALPLNGTSAIHQGDGHVAGSATVGNYPVLWKGPQSHQAASGNGTGVVTPTGSSWTGGEWTGSSWTGSSWTASVWSGGQWSGSSWTGSSWTGSSWTGSSWTGSSWTGSSWTGSSWTGSSWTGSSWAGTGS